MYYILVLKTLEKLIGQSRRKRLDENQKEIGIHGLLIQLVSTQNMEIFYAGKDLRNTSGCDRVA